MEYLSQKFDRWSLNIFLHCIYDTQSHYIEVAQGTEYEILADFGLVGHIEKKLGPFMSNKKGGFFVFSWGNNLIILENILASSLKSDVSFFPVRLIYNDFEDTSVLNYI